MLIEDNRTVMMDFVLKELKKILTSIVVKLDYTAQSSETQDSLRNGDLYCAAIVKADTFYSYTDYSYELMIEAGMPTELAYNCMGNSTKIPPKYRDAVLELRRQQFLDEFVETNNYYRMLNGLPDLKDKDFVFLSEPVEGIDISKPLHLMDKSEIVLLEIEGVLDKVIKANPTKTYLNHLNSKKIPIEVSRRATAYSILYIERDLSDPSFIGKFIRLYGESKDYTLKKIYDKAYKIKSDYYDSFMGLFMLVITAQRFVATYFTSGISRDFYDKDLIKFLFESYGLPFYNEISLNYLRNISKNLNRLLMYKSTDKVFVDIFKLFNMENIDVYKYYLMKDRKTDYQGNPVFAYKSDGDGGLEKDLEKMYDLRFVQVPRDSDNVALELMDTNNHLDYQLVVNDDYLWGYDGEQDEFLKKVLEAEYNYVQTKYISINSKYEITKLTYEICYFYRMIVDTCKAEEHLLLEIRFISKPCKLFDVIVALFAMVCKKMGFDGNIMDTTTKVMSIYGFNFSADKKYIDEVLRSHDVIYEDGYDRDKYNLKDIPEFFDNPNDILEMFNYNTNVFDFITEKRYNAKTIKEYNAYDRLYRALFTTRYTTDMYRDPTTGELPATYLDYLKNNNIELYDFVFRTTPEDFVDNMDSILYGLESYFNSDVFKNLFINIPSLSADNIRKFIFYLIDIFKSYTVDLTAMNIIYHIDSKTMHNIKIVHDVILRKELAEKDSIDIDYEIEEFEKNMVIGTKLLTNFKNIVDSLQMFVDIRKAHDIPFDFFESTFELASRLAMDFKDLIDEVTAYLEYDKEKLAIINGYKMESVFEVVHRILFKNTLDFATDFDFKSDLKLNDKIENKAFVDMLDKTLTEIWDEILLATGLEFKEKANLKNFIKYIETHKTITDDSIMYFNDLLDIADTYIEQKDNIKLKETLTIIREG